MGGVDYTVLMDLKTLQGKKEPYFNATKIVKQYNQVQKSDLFGSPKRLDKWLNSVRTKEIIDILITQFGVSKSRLIQTNRTGKERGTWVHRELFLSLMIWLDAKHEIAITQFINRVVENIDQVRHIREVSKERSHNFHDEIGLLNVRLTAEGSGAGNQRIFATLNQKINKKATDRSTPRGGVDHDTFEGEENFHEAKLRSSVAKILAGSHDLTTREARDKAYQFIEEYK